MRQSAYNDPQPVAFTKSTNPKVTQAIHDALQKNHFQYAIRLDMAGYYSNIQHPILLKQLYKTYQDPILFRYLEAIVTAAVDKNGNVYLPQQGIPRRSSLSPFFGALYLTKLDRAFEHLPGVFYRRYMDDVIILFKSQQAYRRGKKRVFTHLKAIGLRASSSKTKMGRLHKGYHFLGVDFNAILFAGAPGGVMVWD